MSLDGKIAVVTGGVGELGTAICRRLAMAGCMVIANYPREMLPPTWSEERRMEGFKNIVVDTDLAEADVTTDESCAIMIQNIYHKFGAVDILVNNTDITMERDQMVKANFLGGYFMTQQVIPQMIRNKWGRIINISSDNEFADYPRRDHYTTAKAGLPRFTGSIAREIANKGITVNCVALGYANASMVKLWSPEDVAHAVGYLASEETRYITGQTLLINNGRTHD